MVLLGATVIGAQAQPCGLPSAARPTTRVTRVAYAVHNVITADRFREAQPLGRTGIATGLNVRIPKRETPLAFGGLPSTLNSDIRPMSKLFTVATILMTSLFLGSMFPSTAVVGRLEAFKTQVPKSSLIVLAAHARRECRDDNGDSHNCAQ